jgi:PEP-CTERM motif
MKKTIIALALASSLQSSLWAAAVTLNLFAGQLTLPDGITPLPDGTRVQLLAHTNSGATDFSPVTPGAFAASNEIVLASFAVDSSIFGIPGSAVKAIELEYLADFYRPGFTLAAGAPLLLRWYSDPALTNRTPQSGDRYGQYRTLNGTIDGSETPWVAPNPGSYALNFQTVSAGGSVANTAGASTVVVAVPEPATVSLMVFGTLAFLSRRKRS